MRKLISTLLLLSFNTYALPPVAVNGEQQANAYVQNVKVPNYQSTALGGVDRRIETGNTNLLINPSFEDITAGANWTATNATVASTAVDFTDGKKGLTVTPTVAGGGIKQLSTLYATKIIGGQGIARVSVKTTGTDVIVCPLINGSRPSDVTKFCSAVPATTSSIVFPEAIIPFILDGTSNGIEIYSTGTSVFTVDEAFVGKSAPLQGVSGAKLVGSLKYTKTAGCTWSTTSTTYAVFAAQASCPTPTLSGQAQDPGSKIPGIKFASLPAGDYQLVARGRFGLNSTSTTSINTQYRFSDGTIDYDEQSGGQTGVNAVATAYYLNSISSKISYSTTQSNITFQIKGLTSSAGNAAVIDAGSYNDFAIDVYYFPPESKIYSQASLDYDWTSYIPTSPNSAWASLSSTECYHKREGSDLLVQCKFIGNTPAATEARISLPTGLTSADTAKIPSIRKVGAGTFSSVAGGNTHVLIEPSVSYFTFGYETGSAGGLTKSTASNMAPSGANTSFEARIPIQGWQDYGTITGSFAGIEKCANDYECTDTFSATVSSAGVVSNENIDWINGNCTPSTGTYTCPLVSTLKDGTSGLSSVLNCVPTSQVSGGNGYIMSFQPGSSSTSSLVFNGTNAGVSTAQGFTLKCQKGSQDYKPKTAKAATSIGVPTVPGITTTGTGNLIDTFSVSYGTTNATTICSATPCSYLDQIGTVVSSITRASVGVYSLNLGKTYSKLKCVINSLIPGSAPSTIGGSNLLQCANCSSVAFTTLSGTTTAADSIGVVDCKGSY